MLDALPLLRGAIDLLCKAMGQRNVRNSLLHAPPIHLGQGCPVQTGALPFSLPAGAGLQQQHGGAGAACL